MKPASSPIAPSFVLASSSPYRKAQLEQRFGFSLQCISPDIDESPLANEHPRATALRLSKTKALSVLERCATDSPKLIIAGDQTAEYRGTLLSKPGDHQTAADQLGSFSGQSLTFYSGICVTHNQSEEIQTDCVETRVKFRKLSSEQIEAYLQQDKPYDCVGAFKNEALGIALFDSIESSDPSALTGLPLICFTSILLAFGVDALTSRA